MSRNQTNYSGLGKLPPQSIELEEAVLGAIMEMDVISTVIDMLRPEMFYKTNHQIIYSVMLSLAKQNEPIDELTVIATLRASGELESVGGMFYVTELTRRVASAANIEFNARIIVQKFLAREVIRISTEAIQTAYEDTTDVLELVEQVEKNIYDLSSHKNSKKQSKISDVVDECIEILSTPIKNGLTGIPTGLTNLDKLTNGWQDTDLIIIAARPAMGKTAFVLHCAKYPAIKLNKPVLLFSLEMSEVQLGNRMIADEAGICLDDIQKRNLSPYDKEKVISLTRNLKKSPLIIDDTPALNILEFRAKCRRAKQQHDIKLIIIDYLQLMVGDAGNRNGNREQEIGSISRMLKAVAKELKVPVIALSQLSRKVEERANKMPMLSDIRESGSIEQDADMVIFLHRPEYYGITEFEGKSVVGKLSAIIAKHRNGVCDTAQLDLNAAYMRLTDWEIDFEPTELKGESF
ncbi:replicative DNA helicase [Mucilaginibacter xinganensis]|uniref:Replicative DNA helicase n=1 Tax=Mucilaginibacter xinganensis TaxID=1234841 RepID=A0A223NWW7_9SPHI|nr:replicative DNA helicase [Mucilaginibacter xinganensis]ASU34367.1 replicative DNA helicase [Mucilaginibacter xinganensis]